MAICRIPLVQIFDIILKFWDMLSKPNDDLCLFSDFTLFCGKKISKLDDEQAPK